MDKIDTFIDIYASVLNLNAEVTIIINELAHN